jgi:hypothetical protein
MPKKKDRLFGNPSIYLIYINRRLPYDFSLSHHQLLFITFINLWSKYDYCFFEMQIRALFLRTYTVN